MPLKLKYISGSIAPYNYRRAIRELRPNIAKGTVIYDVDAHHSRGNKILMSKFDREYGVDGEENRRSS